MSTALAATHRGLAPDGITPTDHRGLQGLSQVPECVASGAIALALTIQQPWADHIVHGGHPKWGPKTIENRTWPIPAKYVGLRILIHAGKTGDRRALDAGVYPGPDHRGAVIGTARLASCHLDGAACTIRTPAGCGPWAEREVFHWALTDVWALPMPIRDVRGAQKLWQPAQSLVAAVREQEGAPRS